LKIQIVGWIWGFIVQDFVLTFEVFVGGVALSILVGGLCVKIKIEKLTN
jgi:putative Mn2+ efflux pump MntP